MRPTSHAVTFSLGPSLSDCCPHPLRRADEVHLPTSSRSRFSVQLRLKRVVRRDKNIHRSKWYRCLFNAVPRRRFFGMDLAEVATLSPYPLCAPACPCFLFLCLHLHLCPCHCGAARCSTCCVIPALAYHDCRALCLVMALSTANVTRACACPFACGACFGFFFRPHMHHHIDFSSWCCGARFTVSAHSGLPHEVSL